MKKQGKTYSFFAGAFLVIVMNHIDRGIETPENAVGFFIVSFLTGVLFISAIFSE